MDSVKHHISLTRKGNSMKAEKSAVKCPYLHALKKGFSVIPFSLQTAENELTTKKRLSYPMSITAEKMQKVARRNDFDAHRTKIDFFNNYKHLRYGSRL